MPWAEKCSNWSWVHNFWSQNYTVVKVDGATPKRWRFVRGHDKPVHGELRHLLSRWYRCWFQTFFYFHPCLGKMNPFWPSIFFNWVAQPPRKVDPPLSWDHQPTGVKDFEEFSFPNLGGKNTLDTYPKLVTLPPIYNWGDGDVGFNGVKMNLRTLGFPPKLASIFLGSTRFGEPKTTPTSTYIYIYDKRQASDVKEYIIYIVPQTFSLEVDFDFWLFIFHGLDPQRRVHCFSKGLLHQQFQGTIRLGLFDFLGLGRYRHRVLIDPKISFDWGWGCKDYT